MYKGITREIIDLIDIRNFLLKSYYPRQDKDESINYELTDTDLDFLMDYELEKLEKKYRQEKNGKMYFKVKLELHKRHSDEKKENRKYRREKEKIKIMKMEEE